MEHSTTIGAIAGVIQLSVACAQTLGWCGGE